MLARLYSVTLEGIEGLICEVEVDVSRGGYDKPMIVGLPDTAVKESTERVRSAIINSGYMYPDTQSLVNLAPADVKKAGPAFDLPIALGMLVCSGSLEADDLKKHVIVGELALDGRVRPVNGVLSMAMAAAKKGFKSIIVPEENAFEAAVVADIDVYGVGSLTQAVGYLSGSLPMEPVAVNVDELFNIASKSDVDFSEVKGQESVKRAFVIAAAGGHNLLMIGSPGVGKSMLSERLAGVLPALSLEESLDTTRIYSSVGLLNRADALMARRPVRCPHHTASGPSLVGGGTNPRPGELSLAHNGVLFLDEFAEFPRHVLEMIRQPMESGTVTISRAKGTVTFPARFMLVAAMNPCPCGKSFKKGQACRCTPNQIERYRGKISGPLIDRIDIHVEVPDVSFYQLADEKSGMTSAEIREKVREARGRQSARLKGTRATTNGSMVSKQIREHCKLDEQCQGLLKQAYHEFDLSARAHDKILKVSRTIADIEGDDQIKPEHIAEAISYRKLDRQL